MDKQTLSNYGWMVICILVLCVMIALATPFGSFIASGIKSTTQGLFDVNQKAFNNVGFGQIPDQSFEDSYNGNGASGGNGGSNNPGFPTPDVGTATFTDGETLTWEELKLAENGTKYGYSASKISDTTMKNNFTTCTSIVSIDLPNSITKIDAWAFCDRVDITYDYVNFIPFYYTCTSLASIDLPDTLTSIGKEAFCECTSLASINYAGTMAQWNAISFGENWNQNIPATYVQCSDGQVSLS